MSNSQLILNISSKYIIKLLFSHIQLNIFDKIIKYDKGFQKKIDINLEDSIIDYLYKIKIKEDLVTNMKDKQTKISENNKNKENKKKVFLIKYKGFKINDYPLLSIFDSLNFEDKMKILKNCSCFFEYALNHKNIELIYLINEFREKNNMNKLICNKNENLNDFFRLKKSINDKNYHITNPIGIFKNKLLKNDKNISKILLNDELNYIMIFEREKSEYIFIYSNNNEKSNIKINIEYDKKIFQIFKFHLVNNTIPIVNLRILPDHVKKCFRNNLLDSFGNKGFQIFTLKNNFE